MNAQQPQIQAAVSDADLKAQIQALMAENEALKARATKGGVSLPGTTTDKGNFVLGEGCYAKVSAKGAVSIYGFGKWPITLYKDQLFRLAKVMSLVLQFAKDNDSKLSSKPAPAPTTAPVAVVTKA